MKILFTVPCSLIVIALACCVVADDWSHQSCTSSGTSSHRQLPEEPDVSAISPEIDPWLVSEDVSSDDGDYDDFWDELSCKTLFEEGGPRPVHSTSTWVLLRGVYYGIVGPKYATIEYTEVPADGSGFLVPVEVKHVPGKGRAVMAAEDIPEGTKVWDNTFTARFPSPVYFRRFLSTLPRDLACDVMIWSYVEDYAWDDDDEDNEQPTISVDLDEGTFLNTESPGKGEMKNVDSADGRATRLILKGEELLVNYKEFEKQFSWSAAGFGSEDEGDEDAW